MPLNDPIGSSAADVLVRNASDLDKIVNGSDYQVQTRTGSYDRTISGINKDAGDQIARIGFEQPTTYSTGGQTLLRVTQTVTNGGLIYAPAFGTTFPFVTSGAFNATLWRVINQIDSMSVISAAQVQSLSALMSFVPLFDGQQVEMKCRTSSGDGGGGSWYYSSSSTALDDGGTCVTCGATGRMLRKYDGSVNVLWFGAVAGVSDQASANANTNAFRAAHLSMKSKWDDWKTRTGNHRSVFVPAGDYNLSNGYTIPKGVASFGAGIGAARVKILGATASASNKIPLVTMGKVINDATFALEDTTGSFVQDPAPFIDNFYLNPQNSNIALSVKCPGFSIGTLWIQADTGVDFAGSGDGVIDKIVLEDSTRTGVLLSGCQNILINQLYTFLCDKPLVIGEGSRNINIGMLQANYTKESVISTLDSTSSGKVQIGELTCNQNEQYGSFTSVIRTRSNSSDIRIESMDARNYNGYAANNESGLGNSLSIGFVRLRQSPFASDNTVGNSAKGFRVNNNYVNIDNVDISDISTYAFEFSSAFDSSLNVFSGRIGSIYGSEVLNISGSSGSIILRSINNFSSKPLFNAQSNINPVWSNILNPFPIISEGGRYAVKIPFVGYCNSWSITVSANTATGGNADYRRTRKFWATQETGYSTFPATKVTAVSIGNTSYSSGYVPDISLQTDIGSVGLGSEVAKISYGNVVFSVPSSYGNFAYSISKE